jgi:hypothetical protein
MASLISSLVNHLCCTATQYVKNQSLNCMTYRQSFLVSLLFCLPLATTQIDHHHVCTTPVDIYHIPYHGASFDCFSATLSLCTFPQLFQIDEFSSKLNPASHNCQTKLLLLLLLVTSLGAAAPPCK